MELFNLNPDNIVLVKLVSGLEVIGIDATPEDELNKHVIQKAYFIELRVDQNAGANGEPVYKPDFQPLTLLADPGASVNSELDVTLPATSVLFKLPIHPNVIAHYKQLTSSIIVQ